MQGVKANRNLRFLAIHLTMAARTTDFQGMIEMVKDYDKAVETVDGAGKAEVSAIGEKKRQKRCKFKGCKKPHTHETKDCHFKKKAESGKSIPEHLRQRPGNACYTGCSKCKSLEHLRIDCPQVTNDGSVKGKSGSKSKRRGTSSGSNRKRSRRSTKSTFYGADDADAEK